MGVDVAMLLNAHRSGFRILETDLELKEAARKNSRKYIENN